MFWENYLKLCQSKGLSPNAVAKELSIASGPVTEWKRGRTPQNATLQRIAGYFGVPAEHLLGRGDAGTPDTVPPRRALRVPVYDVISRFDLVEVACAVDLPKDISPAHTSEGNKVSAGIPLSLIEDGAEYEELPAEAVEKGAYVALRLKDDSMAPRMQAGDVVIVRCQNTAEDGDTVIAFVADAEMAVCRKLKKTAGGMLLVAANPTFEPIFCSDAQLDAREAYLFGRVVELRAKY